MNVRKTWLVVLLLLGIVFASVPALAQEDFAFREQRTKKVYPDSCDFVMCAKVPFTAPEKGFVVVTASGMAFFNNSNSFLQLTLAKKPEREGDWIFDLTPGRNFTQTYTVRMVFSVEAGEENTFFLNGTACDSPGSKISVETGSITAEFHPESSVQGQALGLEPQAAKPKQEGRTQIRH